MKPFIHALLIAVAVAGCAAAPKSDFTVTSKPISVPLAGFGACMNPYLYSFPNDKEISTDAVKDLEAKVKALRPQFVRIFFLQSWWDRDTDSSTAKDHPGMRESLLKTIRLAQDSGADVLLQFWWDPGKYADADGTMKKFAATIGELRGKYGLTSIKYATIQNEPNENPDDVKMQRYPLVYRAFDKALRDLNLRNDIKIIGGDLVGNGQRRWFDMMQRDMADVIDGYSVHMYWDYWNIEPMLHHIETTSLIVAKMPTKARHPLYITEYGAQGFRESPKIEPGKSDKGAPLVEDPTYAVEMGILALDALNHGFIGFAEWDMYDVWYDRKMTYGLIGAVETKFEIKPAYRLMQLLTHSTQVGWQPMKVDGAIEDFWVSALESPDKSKLTVFALSRFYKKQAITIGGLPANRMFKAQVFNADNKGMVTPIDPITSDEHGVATVTLSHHEMVALTTE